MLHSIPLHRYAIVEDLLEFKTGIKFLTINTCNMSSFFLILKIKCLYLIFCFSQPKFILNKNVIERSFQKLKLH